MKHILLIFLLLPLTILNFSHAYACSGGSPFFIEQLAETDVIVHATVLDVDDRGYNAILRIDNYFKGQGGVYIAVMRWTPGLEAGRGIRSYNTECLYTGGGVEWSINREGYFALYDNGDGTFSDGASGYKGAPHFFVEDGSVQFYPHPEFGGSFEVKTLPVADFETLLLEAGDQAEPTLPDEQSHYPLMRFLNIMTESGKGYRLNPDRTITLLDPTANPIAISPDGSMVAFQLDETTIGLQYIYTQPLEVDKYTSTFFTAGYLHPKPGRALLFSPDSDFAALWNEDELTIYMFENYENGGYGRLLNIQTVAQTDIHIEDVSKLPQVAWSGDSTTLVYHDDSGIWQWDIFEQGEPSLIISPDALVSISVLEVSRSGRYVRYGEHDQWMLLDTETETNHDNAIATPDERNLIFIEANNTQERYYPLRLEGRECHVPLAQTCPIVIPQDNLKDAFWYKYNQIALLACGTDYCYLRSYSWNLSVNGFDNYSRFLDTLALPLIDDLAYDEIFDQFIIAVDDYKLEFGIIPLGVRETPDDVDSLDLSGQLDSPIVSIGWDQPIFYREPPVAK